MGTAQRYGGNRESRALAVTFTQAAKLPARRGALVQLS